MQLQRAHWVFLFFTFAGMATLFYSAWHWYALQTGALAGGSFCNINAYWDCDRASLSSYGSVAGIPIGIFGALWLFLLGLLSFTSGVKGKTLFVLFLPAWVVSIFLGAVLFFQIKAACLICLMGYACFFGAGVSTLFFEPVRFFKLSTSVISLVVASILSGLFASNQMSQLRPQRDPEELQKFRAWFRSLPTEDLSSLEGFRKGVMNPEVVITEFSDFGCPFCARAATELVPALIRNPKVQFVFVPYPIDASCNEHIPAGGHRYSCEWTQAAYCASRQNRFWEVHDLAFEQTMRGALPPFSNFREEVARLLKDEAAFNTCFAEESLEVAKNFVKEAKRLQVEATPTFFVNGKRIAGFLDADLFSILIEEAASLSK